MSLRTRSIMAAVCLLAVAVPGLGQAHAARLATPAADSPVTVSANTVSTTPAQATITPLASPAGGEQQAVVTAGGFAAHEQVTFRFGAVDASTGTIPSPLLAAAGTTDGSGRLSTLLGDAPVPLQGFPRSTSGGLYVLQAQGATSARTARTTVALPLVPLQGGLNCPTTQLLPDEVFSVSGASSPGLALFSGGTQVVGTVNFPPPPQAVASADAEGNFSFIMRVPPGTAPSPGYTLLVGGLVSDAGGYREQLRTCTITVGGPPAALQAGVTSAPIGGGTAVTGQGFGGNEPIVLSLQYANAGALTGTDVPGTARLVANTVAGGAFSGVYQVLSTVNALIPGQYTLTATGTQTHTTAHLPFTVLPVASAAPDLLFSLQHDGSFLAGSTGLYSLAVTNQGGAAYTRPLMVLDNLPRGLTYLAAAGVDWRCRSLHQRLVICSHFGQLAPGASTRFTVTVQVSDLARPQVVNRVRLFVRDIDPTKALISDPTTVQ